MDIVNYLEIPDSQIPDSQITGSPPNSGEGRAKACPLCSTLNHSLSRECFNCGWQSAFLDGSTVFLQSYPQLCFKTRLLNFWWQLKFWWPSKRRKGLIYE